MSALPIPTPVDYWELSHFEARQSSDCVKRDLELTCNDCGLHLCDIQVDDTLDVLARTATEHIPDCPEREK